MLLKNIVHSNNIEVNIVNNLISLISLYVFWYPLIMSTIWIVGGILFHHKIEKKPCLPLTETPMVSILVPCYNEEQTIRNTIERLQILNYPFYEIIAINDGSKDHTNDVLEELS